MATPKIIIAGGEGVPLAAIDRRGGRGGCFWRPIQNFSFFLYIPKTVKVTTARVIKFWIGMFENRLLVSTLEVGTGFYNY